MNKDLKVYVLCGGFSEEREVSLRSGNNVYEALLRLGYKNSILFDIKNKQSLLELTQRRLESKIDLAFLVTHGHYGEDGCLQGFLELLDIPYTGSKLAASANCMNKLISKEILSAKGLPVLKKFSAREVYEKNITDHELNGGIILKDFKGGSSLDVYKFSSVSNFVQEIDKNQKLKDRLDNFFIERFIDGIEVTTSILKSQKNIAKINQDRLFFSSQDELLSLPILELRSKNEFYDYQAKYTKGMTEFILPAEIDKKLEKQIHQDALSAFKAMACDDYARVDFMIDKTKNLGYILELNTLPGMTDLSDMPAQAQAAGISYDELIELIINQNSQVRTPAKS